MKQFIKKCPKCKSKNLIFYEDTRELTIYGNSKPTKITQSMLSGGVACLKCNYKKEVGI